MTWNCYMKFHSALFSTDAASIIHLSILVVMKPTLLFLKMLWWHWRCCQMYRVFSSWLPRVCSLAHNFFFAWCCLFPYASEIRGVRFTVLKWLHRFKIFFRVNRWLTTLVLQMNVDRFQDVEFTKNARRFWLAWQYLRNIFWCWLLL